MPAGAPESQDADGNPEHFRHALRSARESGAAAWTFHTQRTFALGRGRPSLRAQVEGLPRNSPERRLLLGARGVPRLTDSGRP